MIYLDHNATAPLLPEARAAMQPFLEGLTANPSSLYSPARKAKKALEEAREAVAQLLGAHPEEIFFTSGGTESNNWALRGDAVLDGGRRRAHDLAVSAVEHPSVLEAAKAHARTHGCELEWIAVDSVGRVVMDEFKRVLAKDAVSLVSVMTANNEIGTVQDVAMLASLAREAGVVFHSDGAQAAGKMSVDLHAMGVDLFSVAAHKFGGLAGIGALYVRKGVLLNAFLCGGEQERGRRAGTEYVAGAVGMAAALAASSAKLEAEAKRQRALCERLWRAIAARVPDVSRNGDVLHCVPNTVSVNFHGVENELLIIALDQQGVAVSSGSACASGAVEPSHVLRAIGKPERAEQVIRFSVGQATTEHEIDRAVEIIVSAVAALRDRNSMYGNK